MATLGSFTIIKNEIDFIGPHVISWLPLLDQMVFFDGNSTDGTLEVIREIKAIHPLGYKISLYTDKDPKNLQDDYVRIFNECLRSVNQDYAIFLHPDMLPDGPQKLDLGANLAYFTSIRSFGGDTIEDMKEFVRGRETRWKNIYQLRPDLGAYYHGWYGQHGEDVYFRTISGDSHLHWGDNFAKYPYPIGDSGLKVIHMSDVRPYKRRLGRMVECIKNQKHGFGDINYMAENHPRVNLKEGIWKGVIFKFAKAETPEIFKTWRDYAVETSSL